MYCRGTLKITISTVFVFRSNWSIRAPKRFAASPQPAPPLRSLEKNLRQALKLQIAIENYPPNHNSRSSKIPLQQRKPNESVSCCCAPHELLRFFETGTCHHHIPDPGKGDEYPVTITLSWSESICTLKSSLVYPQKLINHVMHIDTHCVFSCRPVPVSWKCRPKSFRW